MCHRHTILSLSWFSVSTDLNLRRRKKREAINTLTATIITIRIIGLSGPKIGTSDFGTGVGLAVGEGFGLGVDKYFIVAVGFGIVGSTTSGSA